MSTVFLSLGGLLTLAASYFYYRHTAGIDITTCLAENMTNNTVTLIFVLVTLILWVILSVSRVSKTPKKPAEKDAEKKPVFVAAFLDRPIPPYGIAFYAAAFLLWCMAAVFFLLAGIETRKPIDILLAVTAILSVVSFARFALFYVRQLAKPADAILLPMPLLCLAVFEVGNYIQIMQRPQIASYYAEILAMAAVLFSVFSFISHFFGREVTRSSLFFALSGASLGAVAYFSMALQFFTDGILEDSLNGSVYAFLAKLLLFAAASILSVSYALMIWNAKKKA